MKKYTLLFCLSGLFVNGFSQPQPRKLTLTEVIDIAHEQSPSALVARYNFMASYWEFRAYKAELLPSLNLNATLGSFNRSLVALQNYETGEFGYRQVKYMNNDVQLSVDQNIALTGGKLSVYTALNRLDQYLPDRSITYNSQPINITYVQPLRAFNSLKWKKKIQPKQYEQAKRNYLETMEGITVSASTYFFNMLKAQQQLNIANQNYKNTETLYNIAKQRFELGNVQKNELLQLELRLLNDGMAINNAQLALDESRLQLNSFLGFGQDMQLELLLPESTPDLTLDISEVLSMAYENTSFGLTQELSILNAERDVAEAKANKGLSATLNAHFGLNQQDEKFRGAYKNPMDQEVFSLQIGFPIMDWGLGKGRIKMAKSKEEVIRTQVEQAEAEHRQNIMIQVIQFNNQNKQCGISARANAVAEERYDITMERFLNGTVDVTEVNLAQSEKDEAADRYLTELSNYWQYYFTIRKLSLYDYINRTNLSAEFDKIIDE